MSPPASYERRESEIIADCRAQGKFGSGASWTSTPPFISTVVSIDSFKKSCGKSKNTIGQQSVRAASMHEHAIRHIDADTGYEVAEGGSEKLDRILDVVISQDWN
jgi:hypothetical protein